MPDPSPAEKLPPLRLDVPAADHDDSNEPNEPGAEPSINWIRLGKITGLVVAVAAATTLVVNERRDIAAEAAEGEVVDLVVAIPGDGPLVEGDEDVISFTTQMYNAGR